MKFCRYFLSAALLMVSLTAGAENSESGSESDSRHGHGRDRDRCEVEGPYAYTLDGRTGLGLLNYFSEAGSIYFDGRGQGNATGVSVVNGVSVLHSNYVFTYVPVSPRVLLATGTRTDENGVFSGIQLVIGVGEYADHLSLLVLPGVGSIGTNPLFFSTQVVGSAGK